MPQHFRPRWTKHSKVDSGYGKSILGPVTGSPVGVVVDRTRRSPVKGRLGALNVVLHMLKVMDLRPFGMHVEKRRK